MDGKDNVAKGRSNGRQFNSDKRVPKGTHSNKGVPQEHIHSRDSKGAPRDAPVDHSSYQRFSGHYDSRRHSPPHLPIIPIVPAIGSHFYVKNDENQSQRNGGYVNVDET